MELAELLPKKKKSTAKTSKTIPRPPGKHGAGTDPTRRGKKSKKSRGSPPSPSGTNNKRPHHFQIVHHYVKVILLFPAVLHFAYLYHIFLVFYGSILIEADSVLAENYLEGFFQRRPTDRRYESTKLHTFYPVESLTNASQVTFVLPRFLGPMAYVPSGLLLKLNIQLAMLSASGQRVNIPAAKKVAPINNTLHSIFKSCRVYLGETLISKNSDNYPYKSYIIDLFSYDGAAKFSWLEGQMFYQDNFGKTIASQTALGNSGFSTRMNLFKNEAQTAYHQGTVTVMGRLHTDLNSSDAPLIPGLGLKIELTFSSSDFLIQIPTTDTAKYKLTVQNALLQCPVAHLSDTLFRNLELKLKKEDATLYIMRTEVTNKSIPKSSIFTDRLFAGATLPSKLILTIIPTENYIGTQKTNPFYFARKYKVGNREEEDLDGNSSSDSFVTVASGSGVRTVPPAEDPRREEQLEGDDDYCFFEKFTLTLNGESVDGFNTDLASSREDIVNFVRLHYFMGFMQSRTGNNFTYEEFLDGFFFMYYDLSTSSHSNLDFVVPSVRQGNLQLQINFSKTTTKDLTLLMFAEYPTLIKINEARQVSMSY